MSSFSKDNTVYFANKPANERADILLRKADDWFKTMDTTGYLEKLRTLWLAYHGSYYDESHGITFGGEQGELVQLGVNHIRNISAILLNMITATRPTMQARSINTDYKSLTQTKLANGLLDYYMRDHRLEKYLKTAVEHALVLGSGYVKIEWNATTGEVFDYNEELGIEIREGDLEFSNPSVFDVYFDIHRENADHDWVLCRSFKNRFDIAAKYPEYADEILRLETKDKLDKFTKLGVAMDDTDLIPVYEFFHLRTDSVPDGKYHLFLDKNITLIEGNMPYRDLPIYCIAPSYYLGTAFAYTPLFDLIGMQDAINSLYSTILTNQTAFGVQSILVPQGANISVSELSSGLNIIEANQQAGEIKPLQLTQTPKEVFTMIEMLEKSMETISGVNSVSRGNPDPNLRSGNALALVQSMTLQYISGLQQSYVSLIEDLGTGMINILKDHANVPRIATIVGKNQRTELKEFRGDDLSSVNRVVVDVGNPLARTTAGRVEMAEQLLQMGAIKTPQQYFSVMDTGQLDVITEGTQDQLNLIRDENERLASRRKVVAVFTDEHAIHIKEHSNVLADPELRYEDDIVTAVSDHIQEHIRLLKETDPNILQMLQQQPLPPDGAPPQGQGGPMPPEGMGMPSDIPVEPPPMNMDQNMVLNNPLNPSIEQIGGRPSATNLPNVDPNLLPNPALQEQNMGNLMPIPQ
jgi:hypothetical protein